jgi:hypothetical protein
LSGCIRLYIMRVGVLIHQTFTGWKRLTGTPAPWSCK